MGCCTSDEQIKYDNRLQKELAAEKKPDQSVKKLLFLGSGGSGKSTLFKQLRTIHGSGYGASPDEDLTKYTKKIRKSIIDQMNHAIKCIDTLIKEEFNEIHQNLLSKGGNGGGSGEGGGGGEGECGGGGEGGSGPGAVKKEIDEVKVSYNDLKLSQRGKNAVKVIHSADGENVCIKMTKEVAESIKILWAERAIKFVYSLRARLRLIESDSFFWEEIDRIAQSDYVPTGHDVELCPSISTKDRQGFKDHIYAQCVEQMRWCLECIDILKEEEEEEYKDVELTENGKGAADTLQSAPTVQVTVQIADAIEVLWKEDAIRLIYDLRATMKIDDSCAYFWDEIHRIAAPDYVPNDKDIMHVRYRTTGVIEQKFEIKKNLFHVFDVGEQKSERTKRIHCFEFVTAVIFCAALSAYDEVMFEDEEKNSMVDSIELFEQICNNEWFKDTAMILFLTKNDLFAQKVERISITECPSLRQYAGLANSYDDGIEYIKEVYESCNTNRHKQVFTHIVNATDINQVEKVFNDIQTVIINASLA